MTIRAKRARGWVVCLDPELYLNVEFARRLTIPARTAFLDSMFHAASTDGPGSVYPFTLFEGSYGRQAAELAAELVGAGRWQHTEVGFVPVPFDLCWIKPERRGFLPQRTRQRVYARDGHCCVQCGSTERLTLDHVHPWSRGGSDQESNLQTLCFRCNCAKGARI